MAGYKQAGADFMNFHWYIADTNALGEAATYLRTASGLPIMTNEVGQQKTMDPTQVTNVMKKIVDLGILTLSGLVWTFKATVGQPASRTLTARSG